MYMSYFVIIFDIYFQILVKIQTYMYVELSKVYSVSLKKNRKVTRIWLHICQNQNDIQNNKTDFSAW